ncbi:MAG: hypothetical protein AAFU49_03540 [Pseudomonadota bacterium]
MRLSLLAALMAGSAVAAPVETALLPDTSGPARLVLAHWPVDGWVVEKGEGTARIRFPGAELDIDLTGIPAGAFDGRITDIRTSIGPEGTVVDLDLSCDCSLALAGDGESRLAIDVVGRLLPAGPTLRARSIAPVAAPLPAPRAERTAATRPEAQSASAEPVDASLAEARDRLILQLQRAADAGMIELAEPLPELESPAARTAQETATSPEDAPAVPDVTASPTSPVSDMPLRAGSGTLAPDADDRLATIVTPEEAAPEARATPEAEAPLTDPMASGDPAVPNGEPECYGPADLALAAAEPGAPFLERLSELRGTLLGEFDRPTPDAVEALARHYIAHGLGLEAYGLVSTLLSKHDRAPLLASLALAVEGEPLPLGHALSAKGCEGEHAAWQALIAADAGDAAAALAAAERIGTALEAMADPLRSQISVAIGLSAVEEEQWATARAYRRIARRGDRLGADLGAARLSLEERLAEQDGEIDKAVALARQAWARGGAPGVEAMIRLARLVTEEGVADPGDTHLLRLDLGAAALTHRGTDLGARAILAEASLRAAAFGRAEALDLLALARSDGTLDAARHAQAVQEFSLAGTDATDEEPLGLLVQRDPERFAGALQEPAFRTALARSYLEMGLPGRAEDVLQTGDLVGDELVSELARAYLSGARPGDAERVALLIEDPKVGAEIEAGALAARDAPAEGLALLRAADAGTPELRARLAWEAEDWGSAAEALQMQLAETPDPKVAARLALALRRAGSDAASDRSAFAAGDPRLTDAMTSLASDTPAQFDPNTAGVARLLEEMRAETAAIREMLNDG